MTNPYRVCRALLPLCRVLQTGSSSFHVRAGSKWAWTPVRTYPPLLAFVVYKPPNRYTKCYFLHTGHCHLQDTDSRQILPSNSNVDREETSLIQSPYNALIDSAKLKNHLENREQFALVLKEFMSREKYRKGHVNFIKLAVKRMDEFKLEKDLLTYNRILDIFPKGRFVPKRMLDAFWPRSTPQLELALDLLTKMEEHGIRPDYNTYMLLVETFGKTSLPVDKCYRIAYWFDKYENADPYEIKGELPSDPVELSRLSLKRIAGKSGSLSEIKPSSQDVEDSFILTASTQSQLALLETLGDLSGALLYVEGPHRLWMKAVQQQYYSLRMLSKKKGWGEGEEEEKDEGPILAVCACQPGTQELLKQWLSALQESYPSLAEATVVYNIKETIVPSSRQLRDSRTDSTAQIAAT